MVQIAVASALTFAVVALTSTSTLAAPVSSEGSVLEARQIPGHKHHQLPKLVARRGGKAHHSKTSKTEKACVAVNAAGVTVDAANGIVAAVKASVMSRPVRNPGVILARRKGHRGGRTQKVGAAVDAAGLAVNVVNGIVAAKARRDVDHHRTSLKTLMVVRARRKLVSKGGSKPKPKPSGPSSHRRDLEAFDLEARDGMGYLEIEDLD
ncbi:hypothetical protein C8J56DRAFT_898545 [Mycena floridula]|nr:hypothetical protein C8J56DRAFT_898545 [Mycena floridula]